MTFAETVQAAINDFMTFGYDDESRLRYWQKKLREAAETTMLSADRIREVLIESYRAAFRKLVDRGEIAKFHKGVGRFTLNQVRPQLRAELDRSILAASDLIVLNRQEAVEKTMRRFSGFATSIPAGGSDVSGQRAEAKESVKKAMKQLSFVERRVTIDQAHKFRSNLSRIIAQDGGAIAAVWHSHYRQVGYAYREDHKERDGHVYAVRGNWALEKGLMKKGAGYTDEITQPAEEISCRCWYEYIYTLRALPKDMLTTKGAEELAKVRMTV